MASAQYAPVVGGHAVTLRADKRVRHRSVVKNPERGFYPFFVAAPYPMEPGSKSRVFIVTEDKAENEGRMATNKPIGDNARKGAVRKRSQRKGKLMGMTAWTKRDKTDGQFMAVKKSKKKFKGARKEA